MEIIYKLQWFDLSGGSYTKAFETDKERREFIKRIEKRDWRGQLNWLVWENIGQPTVLERR